MRPFLGKLRPPIRAVVNTVAEFTGAGKRTGSRQTEEFLHRKGDFESLTSSIKTHKSSLLEGRRMKGWFSSDHETIETAREILEEGDHATFLTKNIFEQPDHSTSELHSINVKLGDINDHAELVREYEKRKNKKVLIGIGGPAAEDQTVIASLIPNLQEKLDGIIYATRNYKESNVNHSAKHSHTRHANALNANKELTGHALLPILILRNLLGVEMEDAIESDYKKVDVPFTIDPRKLRIYFGNELNWMKQELTRQKGQLTEHDINRMEALLSQEIMEVIDKQANLGIIGGDRKKQSSIHVAFTQHDRETIKHENKMVQVAGIKSEKVTPEKVDLFFKESNQVVGAYQYEDTHLKFDTHERNREFATQSGATWIDGTQITHILLDKDDDGNAKIAGVLTNENGEEKYHYASDLHATLGYKAKFTFDSESKMRFSGGILRNIVNKMEDIFALRSPINNDITTATGVSINAIFKRSERIERIIDEYGSIGEIAITNSHWTEIAKNKEYVMVRITGGGNTGSEEYQPSYFINTIANTRRLFGDDLVGVLSTYGCPRSVNAKNSTEFAKIAHGGVISYGKGGTGNTKRHSEAVIGLMMLGFDEEVVEYFNQFKDSKGKNIGDEIVNMYADVIGKTEFIHDNIKLVNERMGYSNSFSKEELMVLGMALAALSVGLYQSSTKNADAKDSDQPNDKKTIVSGARATKLSPEREKPRD